MSTAGVRRTSPRRRRAGDDGIERIEALFRAEYEAMVRLAFTLIRNQAEGEDAVQDSFVDVHRRFDEIRQPGECLRTAVVSHCRTALRRRRTMAARRPTRPDDLAPEVRDLWDALDVLTDDQRIVVVLKLYWGYRGAEIARLTGDPAATVRSHLRRGLDALRTELDPASRSFDDRVANDLHSIAEQASVSTTAWADLARCLDEPPDEPRTPEIALSPRSSAGKVAAPRPRAPERSATRMLLVAAVAGLVLVGGIALLPQRADDHLTAPGVAPTSDGHATLHSQELPPPGGAVEPATYRSTLLGVPFTFTTNEPFMVGRARAGHFVLLSRYVQWNPKNDRAIIVARVGGWNTREQATDVDFRGTGSIDPYDIHTWAAINDVLVDKATTTTVDGRPTTVLDVRVDPDSTIRQDNCSFSSDGRRPATGDRVDWNPCFWYKSLSAEFDPGSGVRADLYDRMMGRSKSRLWVIDVPGADPIVIEAAAPLDDTTFFDEVASTVIATLSFDAADPSEPAVPNEPNTNP